MHYFICDEVSNASTWKYCSEFNHQLLLHSYILELLLRNNQTDVGHPATSFIGIGTQPGTKQDPAEPIQHLQKEDGPNMQRLNQRPNGSINITFFVRWKEVARE